MDLNATHTMLVKGENLESCRKRVVHFFNSNILARYDEVNIPADGSCSAKTDTFWETIRQGIECNRAMVAGLVSDLQKAGCKTLTDLETMDQGYESKTLHTLTHMLDGFFGIDTCFYNLEEDSHWLSDELAAMIREYPGDYWLLRAECSSESESADFLEQIRKSEFTPD